MKNAKNWESFISIITNQNKHKTTLLLMSVLRSP